VCDGTLHLHPRLGRLVVRPMNEILILQTDDGQTRFQVRELDLESNMQKVHIATARPNGGKP
jgi:hypothetical protein